MDETRFALAVFDCAPRKLNGDEPSNRRGGNITRQVADSQSEQRVLQALQALFEDAPHRARAVTPAGFAWRVATAVVADADFDNAAFETRPFGGDFQLEAETVFCDVDALDSVAAEQCLAGLHAGERAIGQAVPGVGALMRVVPDGTGATRIGMSSRARVVLGVVFKIGSMSRVMTGSAVADLQEAGQAKLGLRSTEAESGWVTS